MARVSIRIPQLLADIAGTGRNLDVEADTAAGALEALCTAVPSLRVHVFDEDRAVRRHVNIFVRGDLTKGEALEVTVDDGDEVAVVQAVSGG